MNIAVAFEDRTCEEHGLYKATIRTIGRAAFPSECPTCSSKRIQRERELQHAERVRQATISAGIPQRYLSLREEQLKRSIREWRDQSPSASSLIALGRPGAGKTSQCALALYGLAQMGHRVRFQPAKLLIETLLASKAAHGESFERKLADFCAPAVLLIDDFQDYPAWIAEIVHAVVEARYSAKKGTVLTTNLTEREFTQSSLPARQTWDRLLDDGYVCLFLDESYRRPKQITSE